MTWSAFFHNGSVSLILCYFFVSILRYFIAGMARRLRHAWQMLLRSTHLTGWGDSRYAQRSTISRAAIRQITIPRNSSFFPDCESLAVQ